MKTVKDLIEKYPQILNMDLNGLEFFSKDSQECEILNLIEDFTDVTFQQVEELINNFISVDGKYKKISIDRITDTPSVKIKVKDRKVYFNDEYNDVKYNTSDVSKIYLELLYYLGEYYEDIGEGCFSLSNFNKVKELIKNLDRIK